MPLVKKNECRFSTTGRLWSSVFSVYPLELGISALVAKYEQAVNKESAYEILTARLQQESVAAASEPQKATAASARRPKPEPTMLEQVMKSSAGRTFTNTLMREGARAILGMLGLKKRR